MDVKASGIPYVYHLLEFSFLAVMKSATGFSNFDLITKYSLTVFAPFLVAALSALVSRLTNKRWPILLTFLFLFLLRPFENSFLYYLYRDTLGFSLSVALFVPALLLFMESSEEGRAVFSKQFLLSCLMLILSVSAKGPIAAVYLVGFGFSLLMQLFRKKRPLAVILRGLSMLGSFLAFYFLIYNNDSAGLVVWYPGRFVRDTELFQIVSSLFQKESVGLTIAAAEMITYCFMTLGFLLLVAMMVRRFKKVPLFVDVTIGSALSGMLLMNLTHQYGGSEIYFGLAAYPFAVIGIGYFFDWLISQKKSKGRAFALISVTILTLACIAISIKPAYSFFEDRIYQANYYRPNSSNRIGDDRIAIIEENWRMDSITDKEFEAMLWLKENTKEDAVIATDRILLHNKYMYGTAFSERVFYLEGYVYITSYDESSRYHGEITNRIKTLERFYEEDENARAELIAFGVDYVLVSKWQNPDFEILDEIVFENRDVTIYRLNSV